MTIDDITTALKKYERFGIELGLDRILAVLKNLGNPHHDVPIVHVTGTNGKGSVCAYVSSVLVAAGYKVGRFTSPHLLSWTERICLNNQEIDVNRLYDAILSVEAACGEIQLTQFEVLTAAAWLIFQQESVDVAVMEVGLGGRLDSTNVCDRALVSVITTISLEHQAQLGSTVEAIASEKAGIIKPHCPVVLGELPPAAMKVAEAKARECSSLVINAISAQRIQSPEDSDIDWAIADNISFPLILNGEVQLHNSSVAISVIQALRQQGFNISNADIQTGMTHVSWPGRLQWCTWQGKSLLIDGAHNPDAAHILRNYIDTLDHSHCHWIIGMLATKEHRQILDILLRPGDTLSLVPIADSDSADLEALKAIATSVCPNLTKIVIHPSLEACLLTLTEDMTRRCQVICGSLYLLGEFMALHQNS